MSTSTQTLDQIFDGEPNTASSQSPALQNEGAESAGSVETGVKEDTAPPAGSTAEKMDHEESATVPLKVILEERRKRQEIERQYAELLKTQGAQKKEQPAAEQPPPPDWFTDPEGAARQLQEQFETKRLWDRGVMSETIANEKFGKDVVADAVRAALEAGVAAQFYTKSAHPYADVVQWHKRQKVMAEIGDDPEAYRQKLRDEVMAEIGQPSKAQPQTTAQKPRAPVPKSLAGVTSAQPRDERGRYVNPPSLSEILD